MKYEKDYYQILGVRRDATGEEINRAYDDLIHLNRPRGNLSPIDTARMEAIKEAYAVIGDKYKRAEYDAEYFDSPRIVDSFSAETMNLPEFSEKEDQLFFASASSWFMFFLITSTLCLSMTMFLLSRFPPYIDWSMPLQLSPWGVFLVVPLGVLSVMGLIVFWRSSNASKKEKQCPQCQKAWGAEKLDETSLGLFKKAIDGGSRSNPIQFITCEKFQIHYQCKYCSSEWLFTKVRKV